MLRRKPRPPTRSRRANSAPLILALLLALAACGTGEPPSPPDTYRVRGLVRQLPEPGRPGSALLIHHEVIPDFKDMDGEAVGMEAMSMPFEVADAAMLEGLAAGDKIAFDLEVRWEGGKPLLVSRLEKLPPETRLGFEPPPERPENEETPPEEGETSGT